MKKIWSNSWKASKQPRKQRKYSAKAPAHVKQKKMRAPLSKILRKKFGVRNTCVRVGDEVKVLRGDFKGKSGKVDKVVKRKSSIVIKGLFREKIDGTRTDAFINASNVLITKAVTDDSRRFGKK